MFADLAYFAVILAAIQSRKSQVAADSCFNVAYAPNGVCNSDPRAPEFLQAVIIQDHQVPNCSDPAVFSLAAQYVDLNGTTSSVNAISPATIDAAFTGTMTFNFPIPLATIGDRAPVTLKLRASNPGVAGALTATIKYEQKHSPTVLSTVSTTVSTVSTTTTTSKFIRLNTNILPR